MNNRINQTRFMTQEELAERYTPITLSESHYPAGGVPLLVQGDTAYVDSSDSHSIIFGATGSKKTRLLAMPTVEILGRAGESFVVTDPKGEIYDRTAAHMEENGYQIYCLNLRDLEKGDTWNPLQLPYQYYHEGKKEKAMQMIQTLAEAMISKDDINEAFWTQSGGSVLSGFILIMMEKALKEECHIKCLLHMWEEYIKDRKQILKKIRSGCYSPIAVSKLGLLDNDSTKTTGSIESIVANGLNKLITNERFVTFLSQDNGLCLDQIVKEKTAVYLIVPDETHYYHFVVSIFIQQMYEILIQKAQIEENGMLPYRMNFVIDEFANFPKIESMDAMITAARSRNIRFHLFIQSMQQLTARYKEESKIICSNCNNWIYLYSKEYELLQEISRLCGEVIYETNVRMPLISEFDLQHLNKETGETLVLAGRNYPCITNLMDIDEYPYERKKYKEKEGDIWRQPLVCDINGGHPECSKTGIGLKDLMDLIQRRNDGTSNCDRHMKKWMKPIMGNPKVFLVATYQGMLLTIIQSDRNKIVEGIVKYSMELFEDIRDAALLQWYQVIDEEELKRWNMDTEKKWQESKCVMTGDLSRNHSFSLIETPLSKGILDNRMEDTYQLSLYVQIKKDIQNYDLGRISGKGVPGTMYAYKMLLAKANETIPVYRFLHSVWKEDNMCQMCRIENEEIRAVANIQKINTENV